MNGNEIVSVLADDGSFLELHTVQKRGVLTGMCTLAARPLCFAAMDDEIADARETQNALVDLFGMALKIGAPVIWRISGCEAVFTSARVQQSIAQISGVCPMIVLIEKELDGIAAAVAQMCDFRVYAGCMQAVTGCCDLCAADNIEALETVRSLLYSLPSNCAEDAPMLDCDGSFDRVSTGAEAAESEHFVELFADRRGRAGFARFSGRCTAFVEMREMGSLRGLVRFIRLCDCYSLPLVWVAQADFTMQEAQIVHAVASMTTPKILLTDGGNAPRKLFDYVLSTREQIPKVLGLLSSKRECCLPPRKHDNMPL